MSNTLRDEGRVELLVAGPSAINTALKAICVARDFLEKDNLEIDLVPRFSQFNERKNEVVLAMATRRRRLLEDDAPILREFRVASSTAPHGVAAPMCAALKHHERIVVTAMGAQCVTRALKAAWICRRQHRLLSRDVILVAEFRQPGELRGSGLLRYDLGNARHPPCEIALHIRSDPLVETMDPGYLTPEPSSVGSCAFFSDTSSIYRSEPPTPRCASMPSSPVRESQPPSPSQLAALATYPPGTSRLQAAALREMSMPLPSESPATAAALRSMSSTTLESLAESP